MELRIGDGMLLTVKKYLSLIKHKLLHMKRPPKGFASFLNVYARLAYSYPGATESEIGDNLVKLNLAAYLLLKKAPHSSEKTKIHPITSLKLIEKLGDEMRKLFSYKDVSINDQSFLMTHSKLEFEVIRGNAYPFQTMKRINELFLGISQVEIDSVTIDPIFAARIIETLATLTEAKANLFFKEAYDFAEGYKEKWVKEFEMESDTGETIALSGYELYISEFSDQLLITYDDLEQYIDIEKSDWNAFLDIFSIGIETNEVPADFIDIKKYPVVLFPSKGVLLLDYSNALDQVFSRTQEALKLDKNLWNGYQSQRADYLEDQVFQCLERLFPAAAIYRSASYPDPNNPMSTAEIDIIVYFEPFALFFEMKSGSLSFASEKGHKVKFRNEIKKNIQAAFSQSMRAKKYIENENQPKFIEIKTGRELAFEKEKIWKAFHCNVTLDRFGQVSNNLSVLKELSLFENNRYPWSVPLADLEVIVEFLDYPEQFIHYLSKRISLQEDPIHYEGGELAYYGLYLYKRLNFDIEIKEAEEKPTHIILSQGGYKDQFDQWYGAFGDIGKSEKPRMDLPPSVEDLIMQISRNREPNKGSKLIFDLLELPNEVFLLLHERLLKFKGSNPKKGAFLVGSEMVFDVNIVFSICENLPLNKLIQSVQMKMLEYDRGTRALGIGLDLHKSGSEIQFVEYWGGA